MLRRLRAGVRPVDGWLAGGFVLASGVEAVLRYDRQPALLAANLAGALTFACLALRRARPLLAVSIMTVIFSVGSVLEAAFGPHGSGDAVVPIFALLVVSYSLGLYASRRQLLWGAWQPVLLVLVVDLTASSAYSLLSAAAFIAIFVSAAPILAGRLVRGRNALVSRLGEQAAQIEAHRRMQVDAAVTGERLRMAQRFHQTLITGMEELAARVVTADPVSRPAEIGEIGEIERASRELLSRTREEVVALTARVPDADAPVRRPAVVRLGDAAQPWTVLAGGALCAGLLVETRTLPLHVPLPLAWLACVGLAAPLALAWRRPVLAIGVLWVLAVLFTAFVAPLDDSFTAIGLSFVPPFVVAALAPRRWALVGLGACCLGELACFGLRGLANNGAVVVCCWIAGIVFYERARMVEQLRINNHVLDEQRAAAAGIAVAQERLRVARELHDAVGHSLTVIALQAGAARRICGSDPGRAAEVMRTIAVVARDGLAELRRGAAAPQDRPDLESIEGLLAAARAAGLTIDAEVDDVAARLAPDARLAVYRVVQEALTNVLKHAPGAAAALSIRADGGRVEVLVTNGSAAVPAAGATGARHGLRSMRARVEACGGRISWARSADGGFAVRAQLPAELATL